MNQNIDGLLKCHRDFRQLQRGEAAAMFGTSITAVTIPLIAVATLHASAFEVGLLHASARMPWIALALPSGAWMERTRCRPIMLAAATISSVLLSTVPIAAWAHSLSLGLLCAVALLTGTAAMFFQTSYSTYLRSVHAPHRQHEDEAKLHGRASAAQIAGQVSAGLIAQAAGAVSAMSASAGTFLVSFLCLTNIRHHEMRVRRTPLRPKRLCNGLGGGMRLIVSDPWLRALSLFGVAANLATMGYQSIQVGFLVNCADMNPGAVGGLIAVASSGGTVGAYIAPRIASRIGTARAMLTFGLGLELFALLIPAAFEGFGFVFFAVGGFCTSAGMVAGNAIKGSFLQRYCPPENLGSVTKITVFLNHAAITVGAVLGGGLGTLFDLRTAMWITTAGIPLAALPLLFSPVRSFRDLPISRQPFHEPGRTHPNMESAPLTAY
ncbi:MFS transporter [Streptomyces sp. NBC_01643]|uniref:MFS transporter n=1 Tax=Streptomyces sp. NBC_01643 TaxID=2975906 RepID=UPI002F90EFFF|nr:MFS transporter [Streptomyces sp. NBC_01643]